SAELIATPFDGRAERIDLFALEHWTARRVAIERRKEVTVVRRIEFAAERDVPAFVQCRNACADSLEHLKINRSADVGDGEVVVSGQPGNEGARQLDIVRVVRHGLFELLRTAEPKAALNCLRRYAVGRG